MSNTQPTAPAPEEIMAELEQMPSEVTDWSLCPFCIREDDDRVGLAMDRHEANCLRPRLIAYIRSLLAERDALLKERTALRQWVKVCASGVNAGFVQMEAEELLSATSE